jgi:GLPGLI family protein
MNMKKNVFVLAAVVVSFSAYAQDVYGEAVYMSKTKMDDSWMDGNRDITPEQRKRIEQRMKQFTEKTFILKFDRSQSIYKEDVALAAPGQSRGWGNMMGNMMGGEKYKNITEGTYTEQRDMMGKTFLIQDQLPSLNWQITGETRKIGNYDVIKAVATKESTGFDWSSWRRKKPSEDPEQRKKDSIAAMEGDTDAMFDKPDEIEIVAWFAPAIPVQHGPDVYGGLPGLILELNAGNTTLLCSEITINPEEREELAPATKGEVVTQKEYDETLTEKMNEMRKRWGGRRGGRLR